MARVLVEGKYVMFRCPGCDDIHMINRDMWSYDGNANLPTINPSILVRSVIQVAGSNVDRKCHSFVREGMIQYLPDCSHHLRGQTVALPILDRDSKDILFGHA